MYRVVPTVLLSGILGELRTPLVRLLNDVSLLRSGSCTEEKGWKSNPSYPGPDGCHAVGCRGYDGWGARKRVAELVGEMLLGVCSCWVWCLGDVRDRAVGKGRLPCIVLGKWVFWDRCYVVEARGEGCFDFFGREGKLGYGEFF